MYLIFSLKKEKRCLQMSDNSTLHFYQTFKTQNYTSQRKYKSYIFSNEKQNHFTLKDFENRILILDRETSKHCRKIYKIRLRWLIFITEAAVWVVGTLCLALYSCQTCVVPMSIKYLMSLVLIQ